MLAITELVVISVGLGSEGRRPEHAMRGANTLGMNASPPDSSGSHSFPRAILIHPKMLLWFLQFLRLLGWSYSPQSCRAFRITEGALEYECLG